MCDLTRLVRMSLSARRINCSTRSTCTMELSRLFSCASLVLVSVSLAVKYKYYCTKLLISRHPGRAKRAMFTPELMFRFFLLSPSIAPSSSTRETDTPSGSPSQRQRESVCVCARERARERERHRERGREAGRPVPCPCMRR